MRPLTLKVLQQLSAEKFTSGTELAKHFEVSRSAISDAMKDATAAGVEVFSLTRRGYRLAQAIELLNAETIRAMLGQLAPRLHIEIVDSIGSTNSEMQKRAEENAPSGSVLAAEIQTAGRGRRGRVWQSSFHSGLTFSLLWRFDKGAPQLGGLSLVVGLALVRALRAQGVARVMLKWPNDIVVNHQKLAGVLIETQGDMLGPTAATIGCGVNIKLPTALKSSIDQAVTDVTDSVDNSANVNANANSNANANTNAAVSRNALFAALLGELEPALTKFNQAGFAPFRDEWLRCHALQGEVVTVTSSHAPTVEAAVVDVADDGSLIVEHAGKKILLNMAEISLRRKMKPMVKAAARPIVKLTKGAK
jgi:BirA family transcriptional regulator, biotin operon repressor / biotin---[acetyl-CoA-carboxylase] ligase